MHNMAQYSTVQILAAFLYFLTYQIGIAVCVSASEGVLVAQVQRMKILILGTCLHLYEKGKKYVDTEPILNSA
jgi:hypothetical protein